MNTSDIISLKRRFVRALRAMAIVALIAFGSAMSSVALAANPAEEMTKLAGTTNSGTDPKGNSWESIQNSIQQF